MNSGTGKNYKFRIRVMAIFLTITPLLLFRSPAEYLDNKFENILYLVRGEASRDTNIVIIKIDDSDLEQLGGWPLKRNYYALLISELGKLSVKTIGLEVFLAPGTATQPLYKDLINSLISKSGKVVLASLIEDASVSKKRGLTGRLSLPDPKTDNPAILSGHVNFIDEGGIFVPLDFSLDGKHEPSFSKSVAGHSGKFSAHQKLIKLNFNSSWQRYKSYSLVEFLKTADENNSSLSSLKNKTVILGVTALNAGRFTSTAFDNMLPGVALQAFATENLLNKTYIRTDYYWFSGLFFLSIILILARIRKQRSIFISISAGVFLTASFIVFNFFFIEMAFSFFIVPLLSLTAADLFFYFSEKKFQLNGALIRLDELNKNLAEKQSELNNLQKELEMTGTHNSLVLTGKIDSLKEEIFRLKDLQQDTLITDVKADSPGIENFHGIVFRSKAMKNITEMVKKVAPSDATIVILGESGSGKELIAKAIHELSPRCKNSFIAINCAALTDTLLESELFGHVKGAFTGAFAEKKGLFEAANNGTIFLDEIGETTENFQVKLLRVLQAGEFTKVGASSVSRTNARVIAATNKDISLLVKEKKFREDLYYRLNVISIKLPPLRERNEDIEAITSFFLSRESATISKAAMDQLANYSWKGNVRELESAIKRAVILAHSEQRDTIKICDLPEDVRNVDKQNLGDLVLSSLREKRFSHSSVSETAREIGDIGRNTISEYFRGEIFRSYSANGFDLDKTAACIAGSEDPQIIMKVRGKAETFINNIVSDVDLYKNLGFEEIKSKLAHKYKNLPSRYHENLDAIISRRIR